MKFFAVVTLSAFFFGALGAMLLDIAGTFENEWTPVWNTVFGVAGGLLAGLFYEALTDGR